MEDIEIIHKQTGYPKDKIMNVYQKNKNDIVATICELEDIPVIVSPTKELTDTQKQIEKLRKIVDSKDEYLQAQINSRKA